MASAFRSAIIIATRSTSLSTRLNPITLNKSTPMFSSSKRQFPVAASRVALVLASVETMLPLHSTIAAARLKSNIAFDTTSWSLLSQEFATPR